MSDRAINTNTPAGTNIGNENRGRRSTFREKLGNPFSKKGLQAEPTPQTSPRANETGNPGPENTNTSLSARSIGTANVSKSSGSVPPAATSLSARTAATGAASSTPSPVTVASANDPDALHTMAADYIDKGHPIAGLTLHLKAATSSSMQDRPHHMGIAVDSFVEVIGSYGSNSQRFVDGRNEKLKAKSKQDGLPTITDKAVRDELTKLVSRLIKEYEEIRTYCEAEIQRALDQKIENCANSLELDWTPPERRQQMSLPEEMIAERKQAGDPFELLKTYLSNVTTSSDETRKMYFLIAGIISLIQEIEKFQQDPQYRENVNAKRATRNLPTYPNDFQEKFIKLHEDFANMVAQLDAREQLGLGLEADMERQLTVTVGRLKFRQEKGMTQHSTALIVYPQSLLHVQSQNPSKDIFVALYEDCFVARDREGIKFKDDVKQLLRECRRLLKLADDPVDLIDVHLQKTQQSSTTTEQSDFFMCAITHFFRAVMQFSIEQLTLTSVPSHMKRYTMRPLPAGRPLPTGEAPKNKLFGLLRDLFAVKTALNLALESGIGEVLEECKRLLTEKSAQENDPLALISIHLQNARNSAIADEQLVFFMHALVNYHIATSLFRMGLWEASQSQSDVNLYVNFQNTKNRTNYASDTLNDDLARLFMELTQVREQLNIVLDNDHEQLYQVYRSMLSPTPVENQS